MRSIEPSDFGIARVSYTAYLRDHITSVLDITRIMQRVPYKLIARLCSIFTETPLISVIVSYNRIMTMIIAEKRSIQTNTLTMQI